MWESQIDHSRQGKACRLGVSPVLVVDQIGLSLVDHPSRRTGPQTLFFLYRENSEWCTLLSVRTTRGQPYESKEKQTKYPKLFDFIVPSYFRSSHSATSASELTCSIVASPCRVLPPIPSPTPARWSNWVQETAYLMVYLPPPQYASASRSSYAEAYNKILATHRRSPLTSASSIIILVAPDVDALCAARMFAQLFKQDDVMHKVVPVAGIADLETTRDELITQSEVRSSYHSSVS